MSFRRKAWSTLLGLASLVVLLDAATPVLAAFNTGDVFASVSSGRVNRYSSAGVLLQVLDTGAGGFTTGSAFDSTGNFYVTNFSNARVYKFDNNGSPLGVHHTNDAGSANESIVFDAAGNMYVGQADGTQDIIKRDAAGAFLARYNVAVEVPGRGSDWIDLAANQTTMFYTSEGRLIKRFDVATNTQLADFAVLPGARGPNIAFALRLLGDGGLLVADFGDIKRLNAAGAVIQTYDVAGINDWFALNLDPDGTSFWSAGVGGRVQRFDIATGALQNFFTAVPGSTFGLSVFGELTQSNPVPVPGSIIMALAGVASLGGFNYRRRVVGFFAKK